MMEQYQRITLHDNLLTVTRGRKQEVHEFSSSKEAQGRLAIIQEAFSWIGTPFVDCGDIKGKDGAIDCAMLLKRCYVDAGRLPDFDPRPYPPRWHVHKDQELFLDWIKKLGGVEIDKPRLADIVVFQFGRCYSHGAILVNNLEVVHAYAAANCCLLSRLDEPVLGYKSTANQELPRPVKYFNVWGS